MTIQRSSRMISQMPEKPNSLIFSLSGRDFIMISKITKSYAFPLLFIISARHAHGGGCCTQDFANCVTYCGTTQYDCQSCADTNAVWLPNGVPPASSTCTSRWNACTNNINGCCPGLVCQGNQYWAGCEYNATLTAPTAPPIKPTTVAPIKATVAPAKPTLAPLKPTSAPVKPTAAPAKPTVAPVKPTLTPINPTVAPVKPSSAPAIPTSTPVKPTVPPVKPTVAPVPPSVAPQKPTPSPVKSTVMPTSSPIQPTPAPITGSGGCCTQTFATCVTYCGTTQQQCQTCATTDVAWLPQGVPQANSCLARWSDCTTNTSGCCPGLTCVPQSQYYAGCQYVSGPTTPPTPPPPVSPSTTPIQPTFAPHPPTVPPMHVPTAAPVVVPTGPTIAPAPTTPSPLFSTLKGATIWNIFQDLSTLTSVNSVNPPVYAYLSS